MRRRVKVLVAAGMLAIGLGVVTAAQAAADSVRITSGPVTDNRDW